MIAYSGWVISNWMKRFHIPLIAGFPEQLHAVGWKHTTCRTKDRHHLKSLIIIQFSNQDRTVTKIHYCYGLQRHKESNHDLFQSLRVLSRLILRIHSSEQRWFVGWSRLLSHTAKPSEPGFASKSDTFAMSSELWSGVHQVHRKKQIHFYPYHRKSSIHVSLLHL